MRTFIRLVVFSLLFVVFVAPAQADTIYYYVGDAFTFVQGVYTPLDRITGSFVLSDSFSASGGFGRYNVTGSVLSYSFTDGHQTLTQDNSTGTFEVPFALDGSPLVPGAASSYSWLVDIRTPTSGIFTRFTVDYEVKAWIGGTAPSPTLPCSGNPLDVSGPLCYTDPTVSTALISGLDNRAPGTRGVWKIREVVSTPEGGTALQFLAVGLVSLMLVVFRFNR